MVLEKTLAIPLDCKEIQSLHPKGNQSWIFIGRTDAEAETPILWPHDAKSWLIWKDPDAGKDWRWEEKGMTEDEMVGRHHWLNGHEFAHAPGVGDGQGGLACCSPWGRKESDMTEQLNWTELDPLTEFSFPFSLLSIVVGRNYSPSLQVLPAYPKCTSPSQSFSKSMTTTSSPCYSIAATWTLPHTSPHLTGTLSIPASSWFCFSQ